VRIRTPRTVVLTVLLLGASYSPLHGQIIEVSGGASTLYSAEGGSIHLHGRSTDVLFGAGWTQGGFAAGGSATRRLANGGSLTAGQQELHMDLPTDVFDTAHTFFGVGLGAEHRFGDTGMLTTFAGALSLESGTPLFRTTSFGKLSQYGQWKSHVTSNCDVTAIVVSGIYKTGLGSLQCKRGRSLRVALSAGVGGGSPYLAISAIVDRQRFKLRSSYVYADSKFQRGNNPYQPTPEPIRENVSAEYHLTHSLSVTGMHTNYLTPPSISQGDQDTALLTVAQKSNIDSVGIQMQGSRAGLSIMALHSNAQSIALSPVVNNSNWAFTGSFRYNLGRFQWNESLLHSAAADQNRSTVLLNTLAVDLTSHLRVSEGVNVTQNGLTYSHGGALLTRFSSFQVDYQFFYLPTRPDKPFQQAMLFSAELYLPGELSLRASSSVSPTGAPLYSFQVGHFFAGHDSTHSPVMNGGMGSSIVHGQVIDKAGHGVDGAVLLIGTERVYTDSDGYFMFRERRAKAHPFRVLTDEFLSPGRFQVISSQDVVRSATESQSPDIKIVVEQTAQMAPETEGATS
jgi:hypothetical protein